MATIEREATVNASADQIWGGLISDPNNWPSWLGPLEGLEEKVSPPVAGGMKFGAKIGNMSGKIRILEAEKGRRIRWRAGPGPLVAMGMGMGITIDFSGSGDSTKVNLTAKSTPMMGGMIKAMTGIDPEEAMTNTVNSIKQLSEQ